MRTRSKAQQRAAARRNALGGSFSSFVERGAVLDAPPSCRAMLVDARWRDQLGESIQEFERRQDELGAGVERGLAQAVDEGRVVELLESLGRERGAGTVGRQSLEPLSIPLRDEDRRIHGPAACVLGLVEALRGLAVEVSVAQQIA